MADIIIMIFGPELAFLSQNSQCCKQEEQDDMTGTARLFSSLNFYFIVDERSYFYFIFMLSIFSAFASCDGIERIFITSCCGGFYVLLDVVDAQLYDTKGEIFNF